MLAVGLMLVLVLVNHVHGVTATDRHHCGGDAGGPSCGRCSPFLFRRDGIERPFLVLLNLDLN